MNRHALIRPALLILALTLPWGAGAAPSDNQQNQNRQGNQAPTPSECNQIRQEQQKLLEQHSSGEGRTDYQQALENMDVTTRKRFENLKARLQRCQ